MLAQFASNPEKKNHAGRKRPTMSIRLIEKFSANFLLMSFIGTPIQILLLAFPHFELGAPVQISLS